MDGWMGDCLHFYWVYVINTNEECKEQRDACETSGSDVGTLQRSAVSHTFGFGHDMNNKR